MSIVAFEAAHIPADERRHHLATMAAQRIVDECSNVPTELKPDMHGFAEGIIKYVFDVATRWHIADDDGLSTPPSRVLLQAETRSDVDKTAQYVLTSIATSQPKLEVARSGRGAQNAEHRMHNYPLQMHVSGIPIRVEVMRLESDRDQKVNYIIHDSGTAEDHIG